MLDLRKSLKAPLSRQNDSVSLFTLKRKVKRRLLRQCPIWKLGAATNLSHSQLSKVWASHRLRHTSWRQSSRRLRSIWPIKSSPKNSPTTIKLSKFTNSQSLKKNTSILRSTLEPNIKRLGFYLKLKRYQDHQAANARWRKVHPKGLLKLTS